MNLGPAELIVIFVVALLVFGPDKLPEIGRQVGKAVREFRKFQHSLQSDFRDIIDQPSPGSTLTQPAPLPGANPTASDPPVSAPAAAGDQPPGGGDGEVPEQTEPHE